MKKIIPLLLAIIMVFSLFSCDEEDKGNTLTYTGSFFDGELTLYVKGDTVTAVNTSQHVEDGISVSMTMSIIGGRATVSDDTVDADFSGNITYELAFAFDGEGVEEYVSEVKEYWLSEVTSDADKKLVNDLFSGKTVRYDKTSALADMNEWGMTFISADVNGNKALFTEVGYFSGEKWVFEYYDDGSLKTESFYNSNGDLDYSNSYGDDELDGGIGDENQTTHDPNLGADDNNKEDDGDHKNDDDVKYPMSTDDDVKYPMSTDDETVYYPEDSDKEDDFHPGSDDIIIPELGTTDKDDEKTDIDYSEGIIFYIQGIYTGKYSGMDSILTLPADKQPTFELDVTMTEGDTTIKQHFIVRNGKLVYSNGIMAVIDFEVENISYTMTMEVTGSGAEAYKQQMMNDLNGSNMSNSDKKLYQDALNGKEITFGKESEIYKGVKLPAIKFIFDDKTATYVSERVSIDTDGSSSSDNSGKIEISGSASPDSLLDIGGGDTGKQENGNSAAKDESYSEETEKTRN